MYIPLEIPFPRIDPAAFTIPLPDMQLGPIHLGPFPVRWYALGYIFGLLAGLVVRGPPCQHPQPLGRWPRKDRSRNRTSTTSPSTR